MASGQEPEPAFQRDIDQVLEVNDVVEAADSGNDPPVTASPAAPSVRSQKDRISDKGPGADTAPRQANAPETGTNRIVKRSEEATAGAADPLSESPNAVWYVCPPSGGQFGPATGEMMQSWIEEGRVSSSCWVWQEGWSDWKMASKVFAALQATANPAASANSGEPVQTQLAPNQSIQPQRATPQSAESSGGAAPMPAIPHPPLSTSHRSRKRKTKSFANTTVALLALASVILLAVLVAVIVNMN